MTNVVIISGIPFNTNSKQLEGWLSKSYEVVSVKVVVNNLTSRSTGKAEVTFASVNDSQRAVVEISQTKFENRVLNIV